MKITKENYISASFMEVGRHNIEVLVRDDEDKKIIPHIIEYNEEHPSFKALMEVTDLDTLHENTDRRVKGERKDFEDMAMRIAKKEGLSFDTDTKNSKFFPTLIKGIFEDESNEDHLFALKLALFEVEKIRDSKDNEAKKKIRQGKNKIDVFQAAMDCLGKK